MDLLLAIRKPGAVPIFGIACALLLTLLPGLKAQTCPAALVARTNIYLNGEVVVDSFDSRDPSYSINGFYDPSRRKDGGHLILTENRTNVQISGSPSLGGSVEIYGRAYIGDDGPEIYLGANGSNAALGSTNWVDGTNLGIEPGWLIKHSGVYMPDAPAPPAGGLPLPAKTTISFQGTNYPGSYLLSWGNYQVGSFQLSNNDKILVHGNVKLYVTGNFGLAGPSQVIIGTNSNLTMYLGGWADFSGGGVNNHTGFATNLAVYGLSTCTSIQYSGGSDFIGTIYAPDASFRMSVGGSIDCHLVGSVVANSITINGHCQVHCDEGLRLIPFPGAMLGAPSVGANGLFQFQVLGVLLGDYAIESSTNLIDWVSVYTNSSPFTFTNNETGSDQRFFRAVYLP